MVRAVIRAVLCCALVAALVPTALVPTGLVPPVLARARQDHGRQSIPGQFDFYLLSLSWAPTFCAREGGRRARRQQECRIPYYGFVVHGLWPQYERGFPESCQVPPPRLDRAIVGEMLDLMPARHLVYNEWDRHGTCSGLSARDYFATVRRAREAVTLPQQFKELQQPLVVAPEVVKDAFVKANPDLPRGGIAVACTGRRLSEVRVCLSKDLKFRACPDVVAHSCRRDQLLVTPLHGAAIGGAP